MSGLGERVGRTAAWRETATGRARRWLTRDLTALWIWTQDVSRAVRLARRVEAGQVAINTVGDGGPTGSIGTPFGGYKNSGFGRSMGPDAVEDWTQVKAVIIDAGS